MILKVKSERTSSAVVSKASADACCHTLTTN